jgi:ABC-type branched-subunit amino acid transport system substrate-binding protein
MNKKIFAALVVLIIILVAVFSLKNSSPKEIKIGVIDVLSGDKASYGQNFKKGMEMAKGEYAAINPSTKITLIYEDDAYDGEKGLAAFKKLRDTDHVDAVVIATTPSANSIYPEAQKSSIPVLSYGSQKQEEKDDALFHLYPDPIFSDVALGTALKALSASTTEDVVGVYTNEETFINFYSAFQGAVGADIEEHGLDGGMTNGSEIQTIAKQVAQKNPKYIFMSNDPALGAHFIKEYRAALKGKTGATFAFDLTFNHVTADYAALLGDLKVLDGSFVVVPQKIDSTDFTNRFQKTYNEAPGELADYGYDALNILLTSFASKPKEWVGNIKKLQVKGVTGDIRFDPVGRRIPAFNIGQIKNGMIPEE